MISILMNSTIRRLRKKILEYKHHNRLYINNQPTMATSFEELKNGGRYSMCTKYTPTTYFPVSVYKHPYDNHAIIVKYLDSEQRGSRMALYKSQIKNGLCIFTKKRCQGRIDTPARLKMLSPIQTIAIFAYIYIFMLILCIFNKVVSTSAE